MSHDPIFIEPMPMKTSHDCAVVCLAMYLGKPYPEIVAVAPPNALKRGMYVTEIIRTAALLGTVLYSRRHFDLKDDTGLLRVSPIKKGEQPHLVLLLEGTVYDPGAGRLWLDVDTFLATEEYRATTLLTTEGR